jgi:hypothetical protein
MSTGISFSSHIVDFLQRYHPLRAVYGSLTRTFVSMLLGIVAPASDLQRNIIICRRMQGAAALASTGYKVQRIFEKVVVESQVTGTRQLVTASDIC